MNLQEKREQRVWALIDKVAGRDKETVSDVFDLLEWGFYGQDVLSQNGLGLCGWVFRQRLGSVLTTVKVLESGVPLVGFVSSATTIGCISKVLDLLAEDRMKWQKDKYPWI